MITIFGRQKGKYCDGISRRSFLQVGGLGFAGLSLANVMQLQAATAAGKGSHRSVIMIYLFGGPPQLDMYDMKPEAPIEVRGEFKPIHTNVPGIDICELMPYQAKIADKLSIVRGVSLFAHHHGHEFMSGWPWGPSVNFPKRPTVGSVVSKLRGANQTGIFPYVSLINHDQWEDPAYAGTAHRPFYVSQQVSPAIADLKLHPEVTLERLGDRTTLLKSFDKMRRDVDASGRMAGIDEVNKRAIDLITSAKARDALDLNQEPQAIREKYGSTETHPGLEPPGPQFLQARRLVEAGVSAVTIALHGWDTHQNNFPTMRRLLPIMDRALYGLITDLHERGLSDEVTVLMGGEMARSPKVNPEAGRDHWPEAASFVMAGGGLRMGQIVGQTDRVAGQSTGRVLRMPNILSTLYHTMGIDPGLTMIDNSGRPVPLLDEREPIAELL